MRLRLAVLLACLTPCLATAGDDTITTIAPPELGFFSKQILICGVPIKAHADVSDDALREAHRRIGRLLEHLPEAAANLVDIGTELQIIGKDQAVSDLPELQKFKGKPFSKDAAGKSQTIDERTRGVGGLNCSCGEENLLKLPVDRYRDHRDICSHEFSHTLLRYGLSNTIRTKVRELYKQSTEKGLWKTAYASTNYDEYFAELTMWYFDSRGDFGKLDPKPKVGREWLRGYDPDGFALVDQIYTGKLPVERAKWDILTAQAAEEEAKLRSSPSADAAKLVFDNRTGGDVSLFWLDFDGKRKAYGVIHTGERTERQTFIAHPWLVVKADGSVAGIYVPTGPRDRVIVR